MKSSTTLAFRKQFATLPASLRAQARKQFRSWLENPFHPSLHFKPVGRYWSARVSREVRVLGIRQNDEMIWFFIGVHDDYEGRI
jgi:hypothetical protein